MAEGRAPEGKNGRSDLRVADDLDAEYVGESRAHVLAEGSQDEQFALLVEEEDSREHGGRCVHPEVSFWWVNVCCYWFYK